MSQFTVEPNKSYWAKLRLTGFQTMATNGMISDKFEKLGFTNINVKGSGEVRVASGTWTGGNETVDLPQQVVEAQEYDPTKDTVPDFQSAQEDDSSDLISKSLG